MKILEIPQPNVPIRCFFIEHTPKPPLVSGIFKLPKESGTHPLDGFIWGIENIQNWPRKALRIKHLIEQGTLSTGENISKAGLRKLLEMFYLTLPCFTSNCRLCQLEECYPFAHPDPRIVNPQLRRQMDINDILKLAIFPIPHPEVQRIALSTHTLPTSINIGFSPNRDHPVGI